MADISAARLNNLQARIEAIMGNGAGQNGYGETISSYQVSSGTVIQANDINSIYADIVRARVHQVGVSPPEIQQLISTRLALCYAVLKARKVNRFNARSFA